MDQIVEKNTNETYKIIKLIGEGSFGKCFLVEETATGVSDLTVVKAGDQRDEH
jgi:hypothetical protein